VEAVIAAYLRFSTAEQVEDTQEGKATQFAAIKSAIAQINPDSLPTPEIQQQFLGSITPDNRTSGDEPIVSAGVSYYFDVQSGRDPGRAAFNAIRNAVKDGSITHIVVFRVDRLWRPEEKRSLYEFLQFADVELDEHGVELWADGIKQPDGELRSIYLMLLGQTAGMELSGIRKRTQPAVLGRFKSGGFQGGNLHYLHTTRKLFIRSLMHRTGMTESEAKERASEAGMTEHDELYIDPIHLEVVLEEVIPRIEKGLSATAIAKELDALGKPLTIHRRGKGGKWKTDQVYSLLDRHAQGWYSRNSSLPYVDPKSGETPSVGTRVIPDEYDGDVEIEIISEERAYYKKSETSGREHKKVKLTAQQRVWRRFSALDCTGFGLDRDRCSHLLRRLEANMGRPKKGGKRKPARAWLLGGSIAPCPYHPDHVLRPKHGGFRKDGSPKWYYRCGSFDDPEIEKCPLGYIPAEEIERFFLAHLRFDLLKGRAEVLVEQWERHCQMIEEGGKPIQEKIAEAEARIKKFDQDSYNLTHALKETKPNSQAQRNILRQMEALDQKSSVVQEHVEDLLRKAEIQPAPIDENWLSYVRTTMKSFENLGVQEKIDFIHSLVDKAFFVPADLDKSDDGEGEFSILRNLSTKVRHFLFEFTEQLPVAFPSHLA